LRKLDTIIALQRENKERVKKVLRKVSGIGFRNIPDPDGDTATFLGFNFPDEAAAERFQKALSAEGVDTVCFKKNLWHYLPNWEHFLAKSTANSKQYPFADPAYKGKVNYDRSNIPQAEDILGRTLVMGISVKMSPERMEQIEKGIEKAARSI
jgi:8-amino-3,8-dideoxy-alpha-D-manno-octulosonate transaminase